MYSHRPAPGLSARRPSERGTSTSLMSQQDFSFTESTAYTNSLHGDLVMGHHLQRRPHSPAALASGRPVSASSSMPPGSARSPAASPREHFDEADVYGTSAAARDNFRVAVRVRPPLHRELNGYRPFVDVVQLVPEHANTITLCDALDTEDGRGAVYSRQSYTFDRVYAAGTTQEAVYERSARPAVLSVLEGYNATLMAYGQTGTGKTYTMEGFTSDDERGIIPRAVEDVFAYIQERRRASGDTKFLVRASYMQIYNEVISDLLEPPASAPGYPGGVGNGSMSMSSSTAAAAAGSRSSLVVRHTPQRGVYVDGLSEWIVRTPEDVYGLIAKGTALRATSATKLSELSSRSHAIFTIIVEAMEGDEANPLSYRFGKLNIVDLAGSEKIRLAGVTGQRLEETKNINKSLHELGNVIAALASKSGSGAHGRRAQQRHIPFRNSALTSALRDSLGGNCKTTLIACISPALESYAESLSTLMFANRAKNIQNHAVVNEGMSQATLLRAYEQELRRLRQQLQERTEMGGAGVMEDTHVLLSELEEDRRRAEEDRQAALAALQRSSVAHQEEMRVRQELEGRIRELEAVMREGGMEGNPRTSQEYAERLLELDRERQAVAEDKEQVERYKHLLLKQRDIMLSLTTRLNDRDETILLLQEEVDAYDQHVQELEEELETVTQRASATGAVAVVNPRLVGNASEAQAADFVQQRRVAAPTGGSASLPSSQSTAAAPARYRSLLQPSRIVTAEQLAIELVLLQGRADPAAAAAAAPAPATAGGRGDVDGVLSEAQLTRLLERRADSIVHAHYDAQVAQLRASVAALTLQLRNSEDRAHLAEREARLLAEQLQGGGSANGRAPSTSVAEGQRALRAELETRRKAYVSTMDAVHDAVRADAAERAKLGRELDRIRVEVQHLLETTSAADPSRRSAVSRVWQRLQEVEEQTRLHGALAQLPALPAAQANDAAAAAGESLAALQRQVEEQRRRITQLEEELTSSATRRASPASPPASSSAEVEALRKRLTVHEKDRRALRTILEQRMKAKIDRICEVLLPAVASGDAAREGAGKLSSEARSLQALIHASIKAMDADV